MIEQRLMELNESLKLRPQFFRSQQIRRDQRLPISVNYALLDFRQCKSHPTIGLDFIKFTGHGAGWPRAPR